MFYWTFKTIVMSVILISLVHYLINFFKATLTVPKTKDFINKPAQKYETIFNTLVTHDKNVDNCTPIELLPISHLSSNEKMLDNSLSTNIENSNDNDMKEELKKFLKKQLEQ